MWMNAQKRYTIARPTRAKKTLFAPTLLAVFSVPVYRDGRVTGSIVVTLTNATMALSVALTSFVGIQLETIYVPVQKDGHSVVRTTRSAKTWTNAFLA